MKRYYYVQEIMTKSHKKKGSFRPQYKFLWIDEDVIHFVFIHRYTFQFRSIIQYIVILSLKLCTFQQKYHLDILFM